jgi:hypothetical protein
MNTDKNKLDDLVNDEISFNEIFIKITLLFSYLKSKWKIIILSGIFGTLLGLYTVWNEKPIYKAVLTFAMEDDKASSSGIGGALASSFGIDLGSAGGGGGAFSGSNMAELMKSRLIVEKVLLSPVYINDKIMSLANYYIDYNDLRNRWKNKPAISKLNFPLNVKRENFSREQDSILEVFYKNLINPSNLSILQKDKKVSILTIEFNSTNELFSKFFCEKLVLETSNLYIETKSKKAKLNVDVLQKQVDSVKNELNGSITSVAMEVDNVYNLNPAFNVKGSSSKKRQVDVQANTSILTNLVVQLELAKITLRKETPLIQTIDKPILPLSKSKFGKLKAMLIGGSISTFLIIFVLLIKKIIK